MPATVDAAEPVFHVPRVARLNALLPGGDRLIDVVGMKQVGHQPEIEHFFLSHADKRL